MADEKRELRRKFFKRMKIVQPKKKTNTNVYTSQTSITETIVDSSIETMQSSFLLEPSPTEGNKVQSMVDLPVPSNTFLTPFSHDTHSEYNNNELYMRGNETSNETSMLSLSLPSQMAKKVHSTLHSESVHWMEVTQLTDESYTILPSSDGEHELDKAIEVEESLFLSADSVSQLRQSLFELDQLFSSPEHLNPYYQRICQMAFDALKEQNIREVSEKNRHGYRVSGVSDLVWQLLRRHGKKW